MVPLSSRVEKFKAIHDKQVAKYGKCLTIVLGEFDGKEAAFLLQNMFPIREYYLDHIHTRNNNPVPVKHSIHREVTTRMKKIRQLHSRGKELFSSKGKTNSWKYSTGICTGNHIQSQIFRRWRYGVS